MSELHKDDGGSAFPHDNLEKGTGRILTSQGMTLRDYFAAQALPTCISLSQSCDGDWDEHSAATAAYAVADAMIAARSA